MILGRVNIPYDISGININDTYILEDKTLYDAVIELAERKALVS